MIEKLYYYGNEKDLIKARGTLERIEKEPDSYYVGADIASEYGSDLSVISKFKKDEQGKYVHCGSEILDC